MISQVGWICLKTGLRLQSEHKFLKLRNFCPRLFFFNEIKEHDLVKSDVKYIYFTVNG